MWMPIDNKTLMCCVSGEEADRIEKLAKDALVYEIESFLKAIWFKSNAKISIGIA